MFLKKKNIHCIIQCRMSSSRLPAKIFLPGPTKTLIEHLLERLKKSKFLKKIIIATTNNSNDDFTYNFLRNKNDIFRGSEKNVLERYYNCAKKYKSEIIVRITSDCPLMDYRLIDEMIEFFLKGDCDYLSNIHPPSLPDGFDIEIFTFKSLEISYRNAKKSFQKEHVTPYIWDQPNKFNISNFSTNLKDKKLHEKYRLTLDYIEDYLVIFEIYNKLYKKNKFFSYIDIIKTIIKNKNLTKKNSKLIKVNWYGLYLKKLKSIKSKDTKIISNYSNK